MNKQIKKWEILVVDDDDDVLASTSMTLMDVTVLGRSLDILVANSTAAAEECLIKHPDIAVILLDVVMEKKHSGLHLVGTIRNDLRMMMTRILLRTGQAGNIEEHDVVRRFEIDDYLVKTETSRERIITAVTTAIRAYDQLCRLERLKAVMERILECSNQLIAVDEIENFGDICVKYLPLILGPNVSGAVAFSGKISWVGDVPLTVTSATKDMHSMVEVVGEKSSISKESPNIPAAMLSADKDKASNRSSTEWCELMKVSDSFDMVLWMRKEDGLDTTDVQAMEYFLNTVRVGLNRLAMLKERMVESLVSMGIVAHEFRTPLASLKVSNEFLTLALEGGNQDTAHMLAVLKNEGLILDRMNAHINSSMSNVAVVINQRLRLSESRENIGQIVQDVLQMNMFAFSKAGEITHDLEEDCWAMVDKTTFEKVIANLLSNAVNSLISRNDRLPGAQIHIDLHKVSGKVVLVITDQGGGIREQDLQRIFEPFFSSNKTPAHGLGLPMVKKSLQAMGGAVECSSTIGVGSAFTVTLTQA